MKAVAITWQDHYSIAGWHEVEETKALGHLNYSVGILLEQNNEHTTLAQTAHTGGSVYGDLLHILTKTIVKFEELN